MQSRNQALAPRLRQPLAVVPRALLGVVAASSLFATLSLVAARASADDPAAPAPTAETPAAAAPAAAGHAAGASEAERERQAEAIARSIMSPFCPGRTVSACPNAGPWRDDIRKWVGEGVDSEEIKRRLAARAPEHNLGGVPGNRLGWVLPVSLGLGAVGFLVFLLRYLVSPRLGAAGTEGAKKRPTPASERTEKEKPATKAAAAGDEASAGAVGNKAGKDGKDWDAQLDRELETLEN